jgi:hypothetical protein
MINNLFKAVALVSLLVCSAAQAEIIVVVNNANATALTKNDVSRIFLGKMKKYTPVNMSSGNALRAEFNKKALKKSSNTIFHRFRPDNLENSSIHQRNHKCTS